VRRDSAEIDLDLALLEGAGVAPQGQVVRVRGQVVGPDCAPLAGARIQLWQADAGGRYNHHNERRSVTAADYDPGFGYWGEALADGEGRFTARTVVPGSYKAAEGWWRPPHLHWRVTHGDRPEVITQSWFEGEALEGIDRIRELNAADWILNLEGGYARGLTGQALAGAKARMLEELVVRFAAGAGGPEGALVLRMS
jgi:protocatechuate 3,4-dioxygenase beta subunit